MNDEKLNKIATDIAEMKVMLKAVTVTLKKHDTTIYGNGKDGLLTRASLAEDNIEGLNTDYQTIKERVAKLKSKVDYNLGKVAIISILLAGLVSYLFKVG